MKKKNRETWVKQTILKYFVAVLIYKLNAERERATNGREEKGSH